MNRLHSRIPLAAIILLGSGLAALHVPAAAWGSDTDRVKPQRRIQPAPRLMDRHCARHFAANVGQVKKFGAAIAQKKEPKDDAGPYFCNFTVKTRCKPGWVPAEPKLIESGRAITVRYICRKQ